MLYNVTDIKNILISKGVSENVINHPAFSSFVSDYSSLLSSTNINFSNFNINTDSDNLTFAFNDGDIKYNFSINYFSADNKVSFSLTTIKNDQKIFNRTTAQLKNNGSFEIVDVGADVYRNDEYKSCNSYSSKRIKEYNKDGIMISRNYELYSNPNLSVSFENCDYDAATYLALTGAVKFDYKETLNRKYFDVAHLVIWDHSTNPTESLDVILNSQNGYKDMFLINKSAATNDVSILNIMPLSPNEIEEKLKLENDSNIRTALKENFVNGRDKYSYSVYEDKGFVFNGMKINEILANQMVNRMENGVLDVNGQQLTQNNDIGSNTRNMGFSAFWILGLITGIMSCAFIILGVALK